MTVKRFKLNSVMNFDYGILDDGKSIGSLANICDLLNELHEENQALKTDRARYEEECRLDVFKELYDENEQLKQFIKLLESCDGRIYLRSGLAYKTDRILKGDDVND